MEEHGGLNISETVYMIATKFGIIDRLGYFISDNATNNNTAVNCLHEQIREGGGIPMNNDECRLRYFGHIIHLVVK